MNKIFVNEKIDILYSIILVLIWLIFLLICKLFNLQFEWTSIFLLMFFIFSNLPTILRRKKQYKKLID